ncbi:hypothetical protein T484DRAFT_1801527 [Baffinella frigidus]|nr:hypothetical protein T484DRAFT_1801527 [Cryptophyta sp. CCMP2293]|mmetsp:Transcript_13608/g.33059  ORF Transcript_13608/g.33059 Transcript_13608/m.33059 type:complete len:102 (+) Transcript_13608:148-453(+)
MVDVDEKQRLWTTVVRSFDSEEPGKFFEVLQSCVDQDPSLASCRDPVGITLLHYAAAKGCRASCEFLLARGASKHAKNSLGDTPATDAVAFEHPELVSLLS